MSVVEEHHLRVAVSGLPDLGAALAWAVNAHDRLFGAANMIHMLLEQTMVIGDGGEQCYEWTAVVSGVVAEHTLPAPTEGVQQP